MTVDLDYYFNVYNGTVLPNDDTALKALKYSYKQINVLCRNKLDNGTVDTYPDDVQNKVKDIICEQAEFNTENADIVNSALDRYTINGVTIEYATNQQIANVNGILTKSFLYDQLTLCGLIYRGL